MSAKSVLIPNGSIQLQDNGVLWIIELGRQINQTGDPYGPPFNKTVIVLSIEDTAKLRDLLNNKVD